MASSAVIVCERSGIWAAGLRRALEPDRIAMRETRRLVDCEAEVLAAPASSVLVEWSRSRRGELALFLDRLTRRFPGVQAIALAERDARRDELLAREAGAIHFVRSPRELAAAAQLIRRHKQTHTAVQPGDDLLELVWQSLPWGFE
jgi:DNA-binding response OmpR family regulator